MEDSSRRRHQLAAARAKRALEALRSEFVAKCWTPLVAKSQRGAQSAYRFDMTFDPEGKEISRGISELRGQSRPEVARCLREFPIGVRIPAPGVHVRTKVRFTMPNDGISPGAKP